MGLRKDLDSTQTRYVYHIIDGNDEVIYVGTAIDPRKRFKEHQKRSETGNSLFYKYVRANRIQIRGRVVKKITGTYAEAEKLEIEEIKRHQDTVLNFYNNPNKKRIREISKNLR
jgi:predicted GIY-YIG superfamily endonuclease